MVFSIQGIGVMPSGTIKKLVKDRGFGFIATGQGGKGGDIFFHVSAVADGAFDNLEEGMNVEFDIVEDGGGRGKGPRAGNVRIV